MNKKSIFLLVVVLLFFGCKKDDKDDVIEKTTTQFVIYTENFPVLGEPIYILISDNQGNIYKKMKFKDLSNPFDPPKPLLPETISVELDEEIEKVSITIIGTHDEGFGLIMTYLDIEPKDLHFLKRNSNNWDTYRSITLSNPPVLEGIKASATTYSVNNPVSSSIYNGGIELDFPMNASPELLYICFPSEGKYTLLDANYLPSSLDLGNEPMSNLRTKSFSFGSISNGLKKNIAVYGLPKERNASCQNTPLLNVHGEFDGEIIDETIYYPGSEFNEYKTYIYLKDEANMSASINSIYGQIPEENLEVLNGVEIKSYINNNYVFNVLDDNVSLIHTFLALGNNSGSGWIGWYVYSPPELESFSLPKLGNGIYWDFGGALYFSDSNLTENMYLENISTVDLDGMNYNEFTAFFLNGNEDSVLVKSLRQTMKGVNYLSPYSIDF